VNKPIPCRFDTTDRYVGEADRRLFQTCSMI
jgi:hypothetical protein